MTRADRCGSIFALAMAIAGVALAFARVCAPHPAHAQYHRPTGGMGRAAKPLSIAGYMNTLPWDNIWIPQNCTTAPYTMPAVVGTTAIPGSAVNTTWSCGSSTGATTDFELLGNNGGLTAAYIGSKLRAQGGLSLTGSGCFINTTASNLPQILNHDQVLCVLVRPTGATGYLFQASNSATNYFRVRMGAQTPVVEIRGNGSGNIGLTFANNFQANSSSEHLICAKVFDVCEVQSLGFPCMSLCVDGNCTNGAEIATDVGTFNVSNSTEIGCDGAEGTRLSGDIFGVYYSYGAGQSTIFGSTRASFLAAQQTMIDRGGIGDTKTEILIIAAGQSPMVGFGATPVLDTANQTPHLESIGDTNHIYQLREGTGQPGGTESRMSYLANELSLRDATLQALIVERAVSSTSITTWASGQPNFNTLQTWVTNAIDYACGKLTNMTAYIVWHQGETDFQDYTTWSTELGAIQSAIDTYVRARACIVNTTVKMLVMQSSTCTHYGFTTCDLVTERQYPAGTGDFPGRVYLSGPSYHVPYQADGLHPNNVGQRRLGVDMGRALYRLHTTGNWDAVRVTAANVVGSVVTADIATPYPPLYIDCATNNPDGVTDPGNRGFEWSDASARTISSFGSVTCDNPTVGPTTCHVPITLSGAPGASRVLGVARTGSIGCGGGNCPAGPTTGMRSCIHDSGIDGRGASAPNWAVHQRLVVP